MYKYFSGAGKVFFNTSQASPAPERYQISNTSRALEKYLDTLLRAGEAWEVFENNIPRSNYTHFSGAGELLICTYLAPEKYLYTPRFYGKKKKP